MDHDVGAGEDRSPILKGILLMTLGVFAFGVLNVLVKHYSQRYHVDQLVFFRSLFALPVLLPFLIRAGGLGALATRRPWSHAARGVLGVAATAMYFFAYSRLPLSEAITITFAAPLMATALSVPLLGERVGPRRWTAVAAGFVGVLVVVDPTGPRLDAGSLVAMAAAVVYALILVLLRDLGRTERPVTIVFYFSTVTAVTAGLPLPWFWSAPTPADALGLAAIGLLGGLAQLAISAALRLAPVAVAAPFEYTALLWAALFDVAVFGLVPGPRTLAGAAVIAAAGLYVARRESRLRSGAARRP